MPTGRMSSTARLRAPRSKYQEGRPRTTTRDPSASGGEVPVTTSVGHVSCSETLADGSRSTMNVVRDRGRRVSWVIWPSTQTEPSRWIQAPMCWEITRTGTGCSGEVCSAIARSLRALPTMGA